MIISTPDSYTFIIADDDADDQYLIQQAIKEVNSNHQCVAVENGQQLLDVLLTPKRSKSSFIPDFIILDLNMPLLGGFDALLRIQADEMIRKIPIYVLSTSRAVEDMQQSLRLGARGFFSKPPRFSELKQIIEAICSPNSHSFTEPSCLKACK